jgi:excisionase family DNA binding protein
VSKDEILTVRELAEYLKIAEKTAYRFASEGKVPGFKVGSAWRFKKAEIDAWIKRQTEGNIAKKDIK